jgi:hypothetical protein
MENEKSSKCRYSQHNSYPGSASSSDRMNCDFKLNDRVTAGFFVSNDSYGDGSDKGGEGHGGGVRFGVKF